MVTVIVGKKNNTNNLIRIKTLCDGADEPTDIEIDVNDLKLGEPRYVFDMLIHLDFFINNLWV